MKPKPPEKVSEKNYMVDKRHSTILYLSVPESLRGEVESLAGDEENHFTIDPAIPIPVEISAGEAGINLQELSWEMIVSGMLRVIAEGTEKSGWIDYYRHFVLAVKPSILGEFTEAAILKARNGDFELALEILDALQGLFPSSPVVMLNRALVLEEQSALLEKQGKPEAAAAFQTAEAAYDKAMDTHPRFSLIHFNAGFFYLGAKDFRRAKECFSLYSESADGDGAFDREKKDKAAAIVKDITKNGLDDESFNDAYTLIRQDKEEQAMRSIRDYIERYPSVWNGWFVLGWALRRLDRWQDGAAAFRKALELGGGGSDARNELAICLMELGDLNGARRELETALRDDPENVKIISNLGVLAAKDGRADEAAAFFRAVLEIDPADRIANEYAQD